ncbi:methyl-accepting chemotaxis protein [Brevundimonas sp. SL130]|uniref:methyl-accepting chemotaxis protein n=1 Tax=Brevundimonas sp. SL130 TaxID=2995143 RepID=UPI00226CE7A1|nr:methyl-accepting chemotaxis protein [Brevundimonas sp. SL130]WAC61406.1 methyl-accepting chemotaxis protein [Brevundimonas sp. SL130]
MKLTIKVRLIACIGALGMAMLAVGTTSWVTQSQVEQRLQSIIADRVVPMQQLKIVSDMYAVNIVDTVHKTRAGAMSPAQAQASVEAAKAAISENWAAYKGTRMTSEEQALVDKTIADLPAADAAVARLEGVLSSGDTAALARFADQQLYTAIDPVTASVGALVDLQTRVARTEGQAATKAFETSMWLIGGIALLALALLIVSTHFILAKVSGPIQAMAAAMRRLSQGELAIDIPAAGRRDELGEMASAVVVFRDAATEKLRLEAEALSTREAAEAERRQRQLLSEEATQSQAAVVEALAVGLEAVSKGDLTVQLHQTFPPDYIKLQQDFNGAVHRLGEAMAAVVVNVSAIRVGSDEIASASDNLSKRTEQQAASLEETAAALEEITVTVKRTASGSQLASQVVASAKGDVQASGDVVRKAIAAMSQIEKSSTEITQIIGVIDEIAFQTNLLALNAGVEAARAGESGRGFAVVAQEVRALAQRSAEAAKQIKGLISTSSQQVGQGVALVAESGDRLTRILDQFAAIDGLVEEISASAQEQASSLTQVSTAVNDMDRMVQQNAAMTEESTAASHSLRNEAGELDDLMSRFKVRNPPAVTRSANDQNHRTPRAKPKIAKPRAQAPKTAMALGVLGNTALKTEEWDEF